jgi:hypothetical protein
MWGSPVLHGGQLRVDGVQGLFQLRERERERREREGEREKREGVSDSSSWGRRTGE